MPFSLVFLMLVEAIAGASTIIGANWIKEHPDALRVTPQYTWLYILLMLITILGGFYLVLRRRLTARWFWELFFAASLFMGIWFFSLVLFPEGIATVIAALLCAITFFIKQPLAKMAFFIVGVIGLAWTLSTKLNPEGLIVLGAGLAIYDMLHAQKTTIRSQLPASFFERDLVPGLPIPQSLSEIKTKATHPKEQFNQWLTISEVLVPVTLLTRVTFTNPLIAIVLLIGGLAGMLIASRQQKIVAKPTLWFALCIFVPALIFRLFGLFV